MSIRNITNMNIMNITNYEYQEYIARILIFVIHSMHLEFIITEKCKTHDDIKYHYQNLKQLMICERC